MLSISSRTAPVTVVTNAECPGKCNRGNATEKVTVIPVNKNEFTEQESCRVNLQPSRGSPICRSGDDRMTSSMSSCVNANSMCMTSINIGDRQKPQKCQSSASEKKTMTSAEVKGKGVGLSMSVTVTSSSVGSTGPLSSCAEMLSNGTPQQTLCTTPCSQRHASCIPPCGSAFANMGPTVTSLTVNTPGSTSHPFPSSAACQPSAAPVVFCSQCQIQPAVMTLTSATDMSSQRLCSNCYALIQQNKVEEEPEVPARGHSACQPQSSDFSTAASTTVIKVLDEHSNAPACPVQSIVTQSPCEKMPFANLSCATSDDGYRRSVHVDRIKVPTSGQKLPKEKKKLCEEELPKEEVPSIPLSKPAYQACSKFDLRTNQKRVDKVTVEGCTKEDYRPQTCADIVVGGSECNTEFEETYRPLPFNPDFLDNSCPPPVQPAAPPEFSPPPPPLPPQMMMMSNVDSTTIGFASEKQPMSYEYQSSTPFQPPSAPPRYEEVVFQGGLSADRGHSAEVRLVSAFGRYGELATQPGAFRSPTRINACRSGIVVVTDSAHKTVQAFSLTGQCLALIRANEAVNGCTCYVKNKLALGTNSGIQIYDFNGTLRKTLPLGGPVINTVSSPGHQGFIAVQPKALFIFKGQNESLFRTLKDRSKPGAVRQPVPFDCIADAAVNSQKDIVVLDAGAAAGLGTIYILNDEGYLKSSVVPGHESCGVLRQPMAVAVDQAHNILVSDSANRRVLLFAPNGKFHRYLLGPGQTGSRTTGDVSVWPAGLDVTDDGRMFLVTKGDKFAEIRVFAYN